MVFLVPDESWKTQLQRTQVCNQIHRKETKTCWKSTWFRINSLFLHLLLLIPLPPLSQHLSNSFLAICSAQSGTFCPKHHSAANARRWSDRAHSASSSSTHTKITALRLKLADAWWEDISTTSELTVKSLSWAGWPNQPIECLFLILRCFSETSNNPYRANSPLKGCHWLQQLQHLLW